MDIVESPHKKNKHGVRRMRLENEILREALNVIAMTKSIQSINPEVDNLMMWQGCAQIANRALQQIKELP